MARHTLYFLSRLSKSGNLDEERIERALTESFAVSTNDYAWTILEAETEGTVSYRKREYRFISGKFVKYDPDAVVEVVNVATRQVELIREPNLQRASSHFVYFPAYAMFAHARVWNEISDSVFRKRIADLIESFYGRFFVECELVAFADFRRFVVKMSQLESITDIKAAVRPPNPLFSPFWGPLKKYLEERRLRRLQLKETAKGGDTVSSSLPDIAQKIEDGSLDQSAPVPIGDAAVLMAADGYGSAEVAGTLDSKVVVIKTRDNSIRIRLPDNANSQEVASAAIREIVSHQSRRHLKH